LHERLLLKPTRTIAAIIVFLAVGAGGGFFATRGAAAGMAPDVTYILLDGRTSSLAALRGQVVLVNFWATSCASCVHEMPQLTATHEKFSSRGYQTLAVAMRYDPPAHVIRFAEAHHLPFGVVIDNTGAVAKGFGSVELTPTSVLINKRGEIVKRFVGEPDFVALNGLIEALIAQT